MAQVSPSMGFSGQESWSGYQLPSQGIFPTQGIEPGSPRGDRQLCSELPGKPSQYYQKKKWMLIDHKTIAIKYSTDHIQIN